MNETEHSPHSILVVEDEGLVAMELVGCLEELGFDVAGVSGSVDRALAWLDACAADVDAAILDANLCGRSALPVARALRAAGIPYVVASGYELDELRALGFDPDEAIRKPYDDETVRKALARL